MGKAYGGRRADVAVADLDLTAPGGVVDVDSMRAQSSGRGPLSPAAAAAAAAAQARQDQDGEANEPMAPCPECGRTFRVSALDRHINICKKVFQQKRKQFSSAAVRLGQLDNAPELIANASRIEKQKEQVKQKAEKNGPSEKTQ